MKEVTKETKEYLLSVGYPDKEKIYYLEVWLWLWQEKHIYITITKCTCYIYIGEKFFSIVVGKNPDETISNAINYIVDNDLIK